jgi:hypothetical protein
MIAARILSGFAGLSQRCWTNRTKMFADDGLGAAWGEFEAWIVANGHKTGSDFWQSYITGRESNPDPATWHTELNWPLIAVKVA